jgi:hypothetical protein
MKLYPALSASLIQNNNPDEQLTNDSISFRWFPSSSLGTQSGSSSFPSIHPPHKSAIMPGSRYRVQCDPCPHFLTATVNHWLPLFTRTETVNIVLDYIHQNPVKRGYVDQPEHWRYSSARNYAGQEALIEVIRAW